ncbi:hypothetical protein D3C81_1501200 [compost metagenome]
MPSGTRISEPLSTGMAARRPNSVSFRPSCCLSGMPSTANTIQTAKQMVNANVLEASTPLARREIAGALCRTAEEGGELEEVGEVGEAIERS